MDENKVIRPMDFVRLTNIDELVIMCAGINSVAKASKGSWITLSEWSYSEGKQRYIPICVKTEFVDGEKIKADTYYSLKGGVFVEWIND